MQFFYDVSELSQFDHKTGIQRVVRSVLVQLLADPPAGFKVEPVFARRSEEGYYYARRFTHDFSASEPSLTAQQLDTPVGLPADLPIAPKAGDVFLRLELQPEVVLLQADYLADLRSVGVKVFFGVHDLLPIWMPQYFPEGTELNHTLWLRRLARFDGVVCVSKTVAEEVIQWLSIEGPKRLKPLPVGWFHLGADLNASAPTKGLPPNAHKILNALAVRPTFLVVGTIEPRKGHVQTLAAFERLWAQGLSVNLVVVGRHGWHMEAFVERLGTHPELNRHLFWPANVSDEFLEAIYARAKCLIAPSEGEGFGLPLIEAARHRLPILARNLAVFREVAGPHAMYFSGLSDLPLADAVKQWLALDAKGQAPQSIKMLGQTWRQSTQQLLGVILGGGWHHQWVPDGVLRFRGSDVRLLSSLGRRDGKHIHSTGVAGHLIYGPYVHLEPGRYEVRLTGNFDGSPGPNPNIEVAVARGERVLARADLYESELAVNSVRRIVFEADANCVDIEVRVWVEATNKVSLSLLEIYPLALI